MGKRTLLVLAVALLLAVGASSGAWASEYFVQADIVRSAEGTPQGPVCVPNSVFYPGEGVVFRVKVYDAETKAEVDGALVQARQINVRVHLSDGETVETAYFPHPPDPNAPAHDEYWTGLWVIGPDYPAGVIGWSVEVTDADGRTGSFTPIGQDIGLPNLMVIPGR